MRLCCYLDAQASTETADSMRSPHGAAQFMRARHCHPRDSIVMSVRETHILMSDGVPVDSVRVGDWRQSCSGAHRSCSDFVWGGSEEPIWRLTLEVTWAGLDGGQVEGGLKVAEARDWHVACQFAEDLPCPLAEALERLCEVYMSSRMLSSFGDVWETTDDPLRCDLGFGV